MIPWKLWSRKPTVALWEAVALVQAVNPGSLDVRQDSFMERPGSGPHFEPRSFPTEEKRQRFNEAMKFAEEATSIDKGPIYLRSGLGPGMNKRTAKVALSEVVEFFADAEWPDLPVRLCELFLPNRVDPAAALLPPKATPVPIPTPVQEGTQKKWTDERLAELEKYRHRHGTAKAAKKFNISDSRVRQLLPRKEPQSER